MSRTSPLLAFLLFAMASLALAQPQAPITWGPIRLLMDAPDSITVQGIHARGDTIALTGQRYYSSLVQNAVITVSGDNGQTWSGWHMFDHTGNGLGAASVAFTSQGLGCAASNAPATGMAMYRSTDLGQTWSTHGTSLTGLMVTDVLGDTIICRAAQSGGQVFGVTWTANLGQTLAPLRPVDMGLSRVTYDYAASDSFLQIITVARREVGHASCLAHCRGAWNSTEFSPPVNLSPSFPNVFTADEEFDRDGTGVIAAVWAFDAVSYHQGAVAAWRTQDNGSTWSGPDTLLSVQSADPFKITVRHYQNLWTAVWLDTTHSGGPFAQGGAWYCFSANHGRSWYPRQQAYGDNVFGGDCADVDVRPQAVRIYEYDQFWNNIPGMYYFQWEGEIHSDTTCPVIASGSTLPALLPADTTVTFSATATDNDSLWRLNVVIKHPGRPDSMVIALQRQVGENYSSEWQILFDTSEFLYYYRAEDMWEHVTLWPDSGWLSFSVEATAANPIIPHPSSFALSVSPNPFNPTTTLSFTLPASTHVTLNLYDVLGRIAFSTDMGRMSAGEHQYRLDGSRMVSGVYFARLSMGEVSVAKKIVVMR